MSSIQGISITDHAESERKRAWFFFGATFIVLLLMGIWTIVVGTASMGGDESDLVQGWSGVLRNSPAYAALLITASVGVWYAVRANAHGSPLGRSAFIATSLALLFAMSSVTRDSAEVVMTTRAATVTWILFGIDAAIVAVVVLLSRRYIAKSRSVSLR